MLLNISNISKTKIANPNLYWLIDLDNTVYTPHKSLLEIINQRIGYYISYQCRCDLSEAEQIRMKIYQKHKHAFIGALKEKIILETELSEFLKFCHNFDVKDHIVLNKSILKLLNQIQGKKYVFTNTVSYFCDQILNELNLASKFDNIYYLEKLNYKYKPHQSAFNIVLRENNIPPQKAVLIDDEPQNLNTARKLGMEAYLP